MESFTHRLAFLTLAAGVVVSSVTSARAGNDYCQPVVEERLQTLGVDLAQVSKIKFFEYDRGREDRVVRREAYVWLDTCEGNIAMNLLRGCRILQVYTRGECSVAGMRNY